MRPDDLIEFGHQNYARPEDVESWAEDALVDSGLGEDELELLEAIHSKRGNLLLLGVGGGREAIPLSRMGFRVTGVDFVPTMVERARENAARRGVSIEGMVQEISQLNLTEDAYDVVWLSRSMYSCVPTRDRRVRMVQRIARALKPGGFFVCQFHWDPWSPRPSDKEQFVRRLIAACTLGNLAYEEGDMLYGSVEFIHAFASEEAIRSELEAGGLFVECIKARKSSARGGALCRKRLVTSQSPDDQEDIK